MAPSVNYDFVHITMMPVEYPDTLAPGDRLMLDISNAAGISESEIRNGLIELTGLTDCFRVEEKRTTFEWGASSQTYEIVAQVAQWGFSAIVGNAAWAFLKHITRNAIRNRDESIAPTREQAEENARYVVAMSQEIDARHLASVGWELRRSEDGWTTVVTLEARNGELYTVHRTANGDFGMTWVRPGVGRDPLDDSSGTAES